MSRRPARTATAIWLEELYQRYHRPEYRGTDPIDALTACDSPSDREVTGLVAATLAYGNVKAILRGIGDAVACMDGAPRAFILGHSAELIRRSFRGFRYRVTPGAEMAGLLVGAKRLIEEHGNLNAAFVLGLEPEARDVVPALGSFVEQLCRASGRDLYHLLPHPQRGSACKRLMLYLRWMVRCDAIDPGGWGGVRPAQLIVPLDTHLHRIALCLRLTRRRQPNLTTAVEITRALRRYAPDDPLRYDFALTRPGILKHEPRLRRAVRT